MLTSALTESIMVGDVFKKHIRRVHLQWRAQMTEGVVTVRKRPPFQMGMTSIDLQLNSSFATTLLK